MQHFSNYKLKAIADKNHLYSKCLSFIFAAKFNFMRAISISFIFCLSLIAQAQEITPVQRFDQRGKFWMSWGYNRGWFTNSDIHIHGQDFDVNFYDVQAKDRPEKFGFKEYFSPTHLSIPQNNYRFGYVINHHWGVSIGMDHMKYVVVNGQDVTMSGVILPSTNHSNNFVGSYLNTPVTLSRELMRFEHTNGLNLLNVDAEYTCKVASLFKEKFGIYWQTSLGAGLLIPKTEAHLFADSQFPEGYGIDNKYHVAGYSASFRVGPEFRFLRNFFVKAQVRGGWIILPDIYINNEAPVRADQQFGFMQFNVTAGGYFPIRLRKKH